MSEPLLLPAGMGFRVPSAQELRETAEATSLGLDLLLCYEPPRRRGTYRYVIGADIGDGLGLDRSVAQVVRQGSIDEPDEQVAEFASDTIAPAEFASILLALGDWYRDESGYEALVAIECNNHGLSTQDTLQLHLGYTHFYRWEYYDSADPSARFSTKIGWMTTTRTRPILLDKFRTALTTRDAVTGLPDLITHSPHLHEELKDFQTQGALWEAEAAKGAHDDRIMAAAIAYYCTWRLRAGEQEPLEDRRRRRSEQKSVLARVAEATQAGTPDFRNTACTAEEATSLPTGPDATEAADEEALYDLRATDVSAHDGFFTI
jgi:hypothetical protein